MTRAKEYVKSDIDVNCKVDRIIWFGIAKKVWFVPRGDGNIERKLLAGGHDIGVRVWKLQVRVGDAFGLWFPFWTSLRVGDNVALSHIAKHAFPRGNRRILG